MVTKMKESQLRKQCISFLSAIGCSHVDINTNGMPDIYCYFPSTGTKEVKPFWVEFKTMTGTLSAMQRKRIGDLRAAGIKVAVIRSLDNLRLWMASEDIYFFPSNSILPGLLKNSKNGL